MGGINLQNLKVLNVELLRNLETQNNFYEKARKGSG